MLRCRILLISISLLSVGCSLPTTDNPAVEFLDEKTGYTVRHWQDAITLYRDEPALAAHARDYLSLGPFVLRRGGRNEYFLWVCDWSTIDRPIQPRRAQSGLALVVDGEIMELIPGQAPPLGSLPYRRPVNGGAVQYYHLTRSQMAQLMQSHELKALAGATGHRAAFLRRGDARPHSSLLMNVLPVHLEAQARGQ